MLCPLGLLSFILASLEQDWPVDWVDDDSWSWNWKLNCLLPRKCRGATPAFKLKLPDMDDCWTHDSVELPHDGPLTSYIDVECAELIPESLLPKFNILKKYSSNALDYGDNFNSIFKHVNKEKLERIQATCSNPTNSQLLQTLTYINYKAKAQILVLELTRHKLPRDIYRKQILLKTKANKLTRHNLRQFHLQN